MGWGAHRGDSIDLFGKKSKKDARQFCLLMSWDPTNLSLISSAELILSENLFHDDDDDDYANKYMMSTHSIHDV